MSRDLNESDLYALGNDGFRKTPGGRALALWVRNNPVTALQTVADNAVAHRSKVLDNVIGAIGNDAVARELIDEHVPVPDQASILAEWGDRPSALSQLASPEAIARSLLETCGSAKGRKNGDGFEELDASEAVAFASATIRGLALQIHARDDWEEILDQPAGAFTVRDLLIAAVAAQVEPVEEDGTRPADVWILVGLDPDEAEERLRDLPEDLLLEVTSESLLLARLEMAKTRARVGLPEGSADDA